LLGKVLSSIFESLLYVKGKMFPCQAFKSSAEPIQGQTFSSAPRSQALAWERISLRLYLSPLRRGSAWERENGATDQKVVRRNPSWTVISLIPPWTLMRELYLILGRHGRLYKF